MKIINELFRLSELNQKEFAKKHKIDESLFSKYLKGKAVPRKSTLDRIAGTEGYIIEERLIGKYTQEFINNQKTK